MSLTARIRAARGALAIDATLDAADGETVAVVGPNGAGKTSIARAIAGLDAIDDGRIALDGDVLDDPAARVFVPPARRRIGLVFQERRLFPHLSAAGNVAFGLRAAGHERPDATAREWLARFDLLDHSAARPAALSGGQAALVALARALAPGPRLLVLDEPFAALDAETKAATRRIVREHLAAHAGPALLITHDPLDAFALAGRIAVVEAGRLVQEATPAEIRERPASAFVAELVGLNWFPGVAEQDAIATDGVRLAAAHDVPAGRDAIAVVNPRAVALHDTEPAVSPRNVFASRVTDVVHAGELVRVRLDGPLPLVAEITPSGAAAIGLQPGHRVYAAIKATEVSVFAV